MEKGVEERGGGGYLVKRRVACGLYVKGFEF